MGSFLIYTGTANAYKQYIIGKNNAAKKLNMLNPLFRLNDKNIANNAIAI